MSETLDDAQKAWQEKILEPSLKRHPERKESFKTSSGIDLERFYLPTGPDPRYQEQLGFPGEYPYTRGVQATMYRGHLWTMRQYAGYATAEETNRRYRYLLSKGLTGLSVAFDLPTQIGYDADDPIASGEVGKVGVSISCLDDMDQLFKDIPLDQVSTSMTINAPAAVLLAMYIAIAKRQGVDISKLRGTVQNDILKEYIARGTYIYPPVPSMRLITDVMKYCKKNIPRWNTISISGYHIREAGSTAVQEVAFTLANGIAYVQAAIDAGLLVDEFAPQLSFFFNAHNHLFEEIAKFRAARRLWARIMREQFNAQEPKSWRLRFHTQTAGSTLTAQQPENNIVRVALQALAAVLGGTQSLHTNSMDEALGLPTEQAVQIALRTQQIIAHETGTADTIDPFGGSYLIEQLTNEIEDRANEYLGKISDLGGALTAIEQGYIQREIQDAAYVTQLQIEREESIVVGVNTYLSDIPTDIQLLKVDPTIEHIQRDRLAEVRENRDPKRAEDLLVKLANAAESDENLVPLLIECVEADLTLGEICGRLRDIWGEYQSPIII
ncbi:MAG: methylmalonyl-CoA mutase family protein [Anaerolineaceae bacterium]|nr:MAG: methylmalonyl-CoA mutase family protein [Anaerolineaceae bacterium]